MKYTILLFAILSLLACSYDDEENRCNYQPNDCVTIEPTHGYVTVRCNPDALNNGVPIELLRGSIETGHVFLRDTLYSSSKEYYVGNGYVTAKATYKAVINNELATVYVVNRERLSADEEDYCEGPCYEEGETSIDLMLMNMD